MLTVEQLPQTQTSVVLLPKNRGLAGQLTPICEGESLSESVAYQVRGEDIPFLSNELARLGRHVTAFTGDDLLDEWLAGGNSLHRRIVRRRIAWRDAQAIFGAPALCLIGASSNLLAEPRTLRVAVCKRYRLLTKRFFEALEATGITLEPFEIEGSLETCVTSGVVDLIVDVVVTGRTIAATGLHVLRVISTSDVAVLETSV